MINFENLNILLFMFMGISHAKSLCKIISNSTFYIQFVSNELLNKEKYQNLSKGNILQSFLKLAHFDEIDIFQFLTNFTEITVVSHKVKLNLYNAPLWKAEKICNY